MKKTHTYKGIIQFKCCTAARASGWPEALAVDLVEAHATRTATMVHGIESRFDDDDPTPKLTPIPSDAGEHPPVLHDEGDVLYVGQRVQPLVSWY